MNDALIRRAELRDAAALLEIYNYYVVNTHISFDLAPQTLDQRLAWFALFGETGRYQCFVAERQGKAIGWASSSRFKERAAYQTSVETSVYVAPDAVGQRLGLRLYSALFDAIETADIHRLYAGISLPNEASVGFHLRMGFALIGIYREVGRKFGRFWDVGVFERPCPKL